MLNKLLLSFSLFFALHGNAIACDGHASKTSAAQGKTHTSAVTQNGNDEASNVTDQSLANRAPAATSDSVPAKATLPRTRQ